jgi:hypothetical protein
MCCERGQATVEWAGLVLLLALALGALLTVVPAVDGRSFGSYLAHSILCSARGRCSPSGGAALARAYASEDAELLRRFAPNLVYEPGADSLPVDFRRCRSAACAHAPDDRDLDAARSDTGVPAAAFTHVLRRGGETFLQYWLYYPYSDTVLGPSHAVWENSPLGLFGRYPGFHHDDWEAYFVRVNARGEAYVRASSHHGYQGCKERVCHNTWAAWTGWTRVSKGSHAGHIPLRQERRFHLSLGAEGPALNEVDTYRPLYPGRDLHERTTGAASLELIPLETMPSDVLAGSRFDGIEPPWRKEVYSDPLSNSTS